ncbi:MAG: lipocalin-like domain-containing protein [Candidatus Acidiferrales bacterium]
MTTTQRQSHSRSTTVYESKQSDPNPFVGTWRLVSIASSESRLFGERPIGILMYDADGHVAVQIMRNPRPDMSSGPGFPSPKEVQIAYKGYYAYYGTYEVNWEKRTITHHLEGSLRPGDVGEDFTRAYEISGDRLALTPVDDSQARDACLTWERA